jgi:hypothetical protein
MPATTLTRIKLIPVRPPASANENYEGWKKFHRYAGNKLELKRAIRRATGASQDALDAAWIGLDKARTETNQATFRNPSPNDAQLLEALKAQATAADRLSRETRKMIAWGRLRIWEQQLVDSGDAEWLDWAKEEAA